MSEALDNLGRKIDAGKMSVEELRGLIGTMMKSKVGPAKAINVFDEKENEESPSSTVATKDLIDVFEKYVSGHKEEIEEQKNLIEEIKSAIEETNRKKEDIKKENKEEEGKKDNDPFLIKVLNNLLKFSKKENKEAEVTSDSSKGLYEVFRKRGSGYTHDIYCEKWLQNIYEILSEIARKSGVVEANIKNTKDIEKEISSLSPLEKNRVPQKMTGDDLGGVQNTTSPSIEIPSGKDKTLEDLDEIRDYLESSEPFTFEVNSVRDTLDIFQSLFTGKLPDRQIRAWAGAWGSRTNDIIHYLQNLNKEILKSSLSEEEKLELISKRYEQAAKAADLEVAKKKGLADKGDSWREEYRGLASINDILKMQALEMRNQGIKQRRNEIIIKRSIDEMDRFLKKLEEVIFGFDVLNKTIDGVINKERQFTQDIRAAAFEVAGVTKESRGLQRIYEDIRKTTFKTGVSRDKFQDAFIKGLKSGFKNQKKLNDLVSAQLNTEKQVGLEAGTLGEIFLEYGNVLKFNEDQISEIGRGMREVGRNTGLVGEKLKQAVDSSKQFVDQMRKASTATAGSIKNITGLSAEFQKLGVEEGGQKILSALSSTTGLLKKADGQTKALVLNIAARSNALNEAISGTILKNKTKLKDFTGGFVRMANDLGLAGKNAQELRKNIENLGDRDLAIMNLRFEGAFGIETGELLNLIEGFENQSKTLSDKLYELNKRKAQNLTLEEKATIAEQERSLRLGASLSALTALSEEAKKSASMSEALARFGMRREEFESDINALGQAWTDETDVARASLKSAISSLNEGLKKAGKSELSISSKEIEKALRDQTAFRELTAKLSEGDKILATAQKAQVDPLTSMDQTLTEINDNIRNLSQNVISRTLNSAIGQIVVILTGLSALVAGALVTSAKGAIQLGNILSFFARFRDPSQDVAQDPMSSVKKIFSKESIFGKRDKEKGVLPETKPVAAMEIPKDNSRLKESFKEKVNTTLIDINKSMLDVLNRIANCVCGASTEATKVVKEDSLQPVSVMPKDQKIESPVKEVEKTVTKATETKQSKLSPEEIATRRAAGAAAKQRSEAMGISPAVAKSIKRQEIKNIKNDKTLNAIERKNLVNEVSMGRKTKNIVELERKYAKSQQQKIKGSKVPKVAGIDLSELMSSGKEMTKTAAGILVLSAGAVALGAAIVFLSNQILGAFDLDMTKILQTAGAVGALAAAGGAIAVAGYAAFKALTGDRESNEFGKVSELFSKDILKKAAAIVLIGPALVILGASIVKLSQMIVGAFGLDMTTVAQTAGTVASIVGAAGALTYAASEALEGFEKMSDNKLMKNPGKMKSVMMQGAKAILMVGPGLVLLGAAIVKFAQIVLGVLGLDAATIGRVAGRVAALIAATGAIAASIIGASAGLWGLGKLWENIGSWKDSMLKGALALSVMTPLIVTLAAALNKIVGGILGIMGVDAGTAAKVAYDVASLILSTGVIAGAIIGALAGMAGLGMLAAANLGPQSLAILGGAAALFLITPAIVVLAAALSNMMSSIMSAMGIDAGKAAATAMQVAGIIGGAGLIALGVMGAVAGLAGLGSFAAAMGPSILLMTLGAAALYALTPVVLSLASSIIQMAGVIAGSLISADEVKKITDSVGSILGGAAKISLSLLASVAGLSILGTMFTAAMIAIPFMWLGTKAFNALISPVVGFIGAVKEASNKIGSIISPSEAASMSESVATILKSVGDITARIASVGPSLASVPVYGGFWNWLRGSTVADRMNDGVEALRSLSSPISNYVSAIKEFARKIGGEVNPSQAAEMASGVGEVLGACAKITENIFKSAEPLKNLSAYEGFFSWLMGNSIGSMVTNGTKALENLSAPIRNYVSSIRRFSSGLGITPREAAEMAVGVEDILCAVGGITKIILGTKDSLSSIDSGWGWFGNKYTKQMNTGVKALSKMGGPVVSYINVIKKISKKIGKRLPPRVAASMANGVAEVISGTGEVTEKVLDTKEKLSKMKTTSGWGWFKKDYVKSSYEGVEALKELSGPIVKYVETIKEFSTTVGRKLDTRKAYSMACGVSSILEASGTVTEQIVATKDKLSSIKSSEGFWLWATDIPASMNKGVTALNELKQPIIDYVDSISKFGADLSGKIDPSKAKASIQSLNAVTEIIDSFGKILTNLKEKITPMTEGWISSPIKEMIAAQKEVKEFFPSLLSFVQSLASQLNLSFKDNENDLRSGAKNLSLISQMFDGLASTVSRVKESIVPITKEGIFTSSDMNNITGAIPKFQESFGSITKFVNEGIVGPVSKLEFSSLGQSARKIANMGSLLKETTVSLESLHSIATLTQGGFWSSAPIKQIADSKEKLVVWFNEISSLVNESIIKSIKKMSPGEGLDSVREKVVVLGEVLTGMGKALDGLGRILSFVWNSSFWEKSPAKKIIDNEKKLKETFTSIGDFISNGMLAPIKKINTDDIVDSNETLWHLSKTLEYVPIVLQNLGKTIQISTETDDYFGKTLINKILDARKVFSDAFEQIAMFIKEGIVLPAQKGFSGVNIEAASKNMSSMANMASSIMPIIENLGKVMNMMSGETGNKLDTEYKIDKIISYKDKFASYFKDIAIFLRDGIISPVQEVFPDTKGLSKARSTIYSISSIVSTVPKLILGIADGFLPLIEGGDNLKEIPMEAIKRVKGDFAQRFIEIAKFLNEGIIGPVSNSFENSRQVSKAASSLNRMKSIISSVSSIVSNLSESMINLRSDSTQEAPINTINKESVLFSDWFLNIIKFFNSGILDPLKNVDSKNFNAIGSKTNALKNQINNLPEIFYGVEQSLNSLSNESFSNLKEFKTDKLTLYFEKMSELINKGIIEPIQSVFPDISELVEVDKKLSAIASIIDKISNTMANAGRAMLGMTPINLKELSNIKQIKNISGEAVSSGTDSVLKSVDLEKSSEPKFSDSKEIQAVVEKAILGKTEVAIDVAERHAEAAAIAALSKKTGRTELSGVEVDTQIDMEKKVVKAVARWSKENHEAALGVKKSMEDTGAAYGGAGRSALPTVVPPKQEQIVRLDVGQSPGSQFQRRLQRLLARGGAGDGIRSADIAPQPKTTGEALKGENIPKFAEGGVVNKATLGVIGEAGPEAVVPLSGIEKYSSGIISGLEKINSNLIKLISATTKGGKKGRVKSLMIPGENSDDEGSVISPIIDISKNALSFSLGMAMTPALNKMSKSFKDISKDITKNFGGAANQIKVFVSKGSESTFNHMGVVAAGAFGLMETISNQISSYALSAFESIKSLVPQTVKDYAGKAFNNMSGYFSSAFTPLTKGFTRSINAGEGIFKSLGRGIQSQYMSITKGKPITEIASNAFSYVKDKASSAFNSMSGYFSSALVPLTKGFTRSMNAGEGIFKSLGRGIQSQYMSITKGKPITEIASNAFNYVKDNASKAFSYIGSKIPQPIKDYASKAFNYVKDNASKAFSYIGSKISQPIKDYASKAFNSMSGYFSSAFAPLTKGFTRSMNAGEGIFKSLGRGIQSQYMSITKGKPITEIANNAFSYVKDNASKAFSYIGSKIPQPIKDYASKAFNGMSGYFSSAFAPLTKGFTRSMSAGEGIFKSLGRGIQSQYMSITKGKPITEIANNAFNYVKGNASKAFNNMSGYFSSAFMPLTKGFTRSMNAGEGIFKSLSRGIQSQYMSITKGKPITEIASNAFNYVKDNASKAFSYIGSKIPQPVKDYASKAFNKVSELAKPAWEKLKSYGSQAFNKISENARPLWEKLKLYGSKMFANMSSSLGYLTKGKSISELAGTTFSAIREYGKKGFSKLAGLLGGGAKKAKDGVAAAGGMVKGFFTKKTARKEGGAGASIMSGDISPIENVKKIGDVGTSVKGNFEGVKEALRNLAEGVKSFANKEAFLGALNLIPTGIGLTAMIPGFLGAKLIEKIGGEKLKESFSGLSEGLGMMANGKVLLGAGSLLLASIGMLALLPALPGLAILGGISGLVTSGLTALSTGLTTFGSAAANPMFWLGILGIGALGAALIPLGYSLSNLSPLITAFGTAVGTILGGIVGIITSVALGMTSFLDAVSLEKAAGLVGIATGLFLLSGAIVAFSLATAASGWISFFGGNSKTLDNVTKLADAGPNLSLFAEALSTITAELANFEASLNNIDSVEENLNRLISMSLKIGSLAPVIQAASQMISASQMIQNIQTPELTTKQPVEKTGLAPTSFKSQFTDEWSEKYHPSPTKSIESSLSTNKVIGKRTKQTSIIESSIAPNKDDGILGEKSLTVGSVASTSPVESANESLNLIKSPVATDKTMGTIGGNLESNPMFYEFLNIATKGKGILVRMALPQTDTFEYAGNSISSAASFVFESIINSFNGVLNTISSTVSSVFRSVASIFSSIGSVITSTLKSVFIDLPFVIIKGLSSLGSYILSGLGFIFVSIPKAIGGILLGSLKTIFVSVPKAVGGILLSSLKTIFVSIPKAIGGILLGSLKTIFVSIPKAIGSLLLNGIKAVFVDVPKILGNLLLEGIKLIFVTLPSIILSGLGSLASLIISGLKTLFVTLPIMLSGLITKSLKSLFVDLPLMIGGLIINGIKSVFIDLPVWLGSTILNGINSIISAIPSAIYNALYSAASMVGLGWVVKKMAGGGSAEKETETESRAAKEIKPATSKETSSGISFVGLIEELKNILGFTPSAIDQIVPLMSDFFTAGTNGKGILVNILSSIGGGPQKVSPAKALESDVLQENKVIKMPKINRERSSLDMISGKDTLVSTLSSIDGGMSNQLFGSQEVAPTKALESNVLQENKIIKMPKINKDISYPANTNKPKGILGSIDKWIGTDLTGSKAAQKTVDGFNISGLLGSVNADLESMSVPGFEGVVPDVEPTTGMPSISSQPSVSSISPSISSGVNVEQNLMKEKASIEPQKSEVVSPELGALTTETEEQTIILMQMKELFEKFVDLLQPKSSTTTSEGGEPGNTMSKKVVGKPTNYYRRVAGNVSQVPGRSSLNLGAKAVS